MSVVDFVGGPKLSRLLTAIPWLRRLEGRSLAEEAADVSVQENHVVVAGYGLNGQTVVRALKSLGMPHSVLDLNPDAVRAGRQLGESMFYGDCTRAEVLRRVHLDTARVYVIAISDPQATWQTLQVARHENPVLHIIVRTKYVAEIEVLRRLGADVVIAEEFETSLEILARVLHSFNLPRLKIEEIVQHFRGDAYEAFRGPSALLDEELLGKVLPILQIEAGHHPGRRCRGRTELARTRPTGTDRGHPAGRTARWPNGNGTATRLTAPREGLGGSRRCAAPDSERYSFTGTTTGITHPLRAVWPSSLFRRTRERRDSSPCVIEDLP